MGRAPCCDKANVKKGPWSPEEDSKLKEYIEKHGTGGNWIALPQKAGLKRCGKSCRLRWLNYLRPNIKHGEFTDEEDRIICTLFASIGSRWSIIAAQLPGRTDNDIKNYWNTKLKKKLMALAPQNQRKPLPFPSPHPPLSSSLFSLYKDSSSASSSSSFSYPFYNPNPLLNKPSFTGSFEPLLSSVPSNFLPNISTSTSSCSSLFQTQQGLMNPIQFYNQSQPRDSNLLVFGSEASCSSNSDGSCSQIKQEEIGFHNYSNGFEENQQKFMLSYGNGSENLNQWVGSGGETTGSQLDYDLEEVKQLISSSSNHHNESSSNSNLNAVMGENKTEEKLMYYYYY